MTITCLIFTTLFKTLELIENVITSQAGQPLHHDWRVERLKEKENIKLQS